MSKASNIWKWRVSRRSRAAKQRRFHLPKQYYFSLKTLVGTAEFAASVIESGGVREAILASGWYGEIRQRVNFNANQCEIWIRRMSKLWQGQQVKRIKAEWSAARVRCPKPKDKSRAKRKKLPDKSQLLQALLKDKNIYAVSSRSLSPLILYQKLLDRCNGAPDFGQWHGLRQLVMAKKVRVIARVFIGAITNGRFNRYRGRFDWPTEFKGIILKIRFEAEGFKVNWKVKLVSDNCNLVRGWDRHFLHRMDRLDQLGSLVAERLKESGKNHLIRDLGLIACKAA